jgi:hypothetical protein
MKQSNFELKKQSEWFLTSSHLLFGATAIKLFELKVSEFSIDRGISSLFGLFLALIFVRLGLSAARKVKE